MSLFAPKTEKRSDDWTDWLDGGSTPSSSSNPTTLVPFYAAIRHIVDYMATLPVDGNRAGAPMGLPRLFARLNEPGDVGIGNWIGQWAYGLAVDGNAVGWVTAVDGFGFPIGIRWIRKINWSYDEFTGIWYIFGEPADPARIVHQPWIVPIGYRLGISPLEHFRDFWKAGKAAQEYADVSRGGGTPPAVLTNTVMTELDPASSRAIQRRARSTFASGDPFVTGRDWKLDMMTVPPNQAQFLETLELTANQIAGIFGIDPREIGGTGSDGTITYRTDESRALNRANDMRPYIERFEDMANRLLPSVQCIRLNVDATLRSDALSRANIFNIRLGNGSTNINEYRAIEGEPPIGPEGDIYRIPAPAPVAPVTREQGDHP